MVLTNEHPAKRISLIPTYKPVKNLHCRCLIKKLRGIFAGAVITPEKSIFWKNEFINII
jgi:hypothetical protein